jgi:molybdate transport system ATP-binding protein
VSASVLDAKVALRRGDFRLDAALSLDDGITALFGPSGAGKTTLLHCLAGLATPDSGRIELQGSTLFDSAANVSLPPERRRIGIVFQDLRLFPHLTAERNLDFGRRHEGEGPSPDRVLDVLELRPLLRRRPPDLSGGEARRVALGRALLAAPRLLLLDEPMAGLDEARKGAVIELLARVRAEFALPMLLVSHSLPDILELTTRVAVLDAGTLLGQGDIHDVLGSERVFRLAETLGMESVLQIEIVESDADAGVTRARLGDAVVALPLVDRAPGTRALVAVRPEDVILARGPVPGISAQNAMPGTVSRIVHLPDRLLVTVQVGGTPGGALRAEITPRSARDLGIAPGALVTCLVKVFSFRWRRFLPD